MKTVLVIEDEESCLKLYQTFMGISKDLRFVGVGSAEAAQEFLRKEKVAAIISDVHLPGIDGIEFFNHLKDRGELVSPFVIVTGHSSPQYAALLDQGVDRIFSKPVLYREVVAFVSQALKQKEGAA